MGIFKKNWMRLMMKTKNRMTSLKKLNEAHDEKEKTGVDKKDDEHLKKQLEALKKYAHDMEEKLKKKLGDMEKKNENLKKKLDEVNDEKEKYEDILKKLNEVNDEKEKKEGNKKDDDHLKKQLEALKKYANDMENKLKKK